MFCGPDVTKTWQVSTIAVMLFNQKAIEAALVFLDHSTGATSMRNANFAYGQSVTTV